MLRVDDNCEHIPHKCVIKERIEQMIRYNKADHRIGRGGLKAFVEKQ